MVTTVWLSIVKVNVTKNTENEQNCFAFIEMSGLVCKVLTLLNFVFQTWLFISSNRLRSSLDLIEETNINIFCLPVIMMK